MTRSNNTTRARAHAHETKAEKVRDADKQSKSILECLTIDSNGTVTGIKFIADAHEAKAEKVLHAYMQYSNHRPPKPLTKESFDEMADQHDRAYHAMWSGPDTEPEDSIDAFVRSNQIATIVTLGAFTVLSLSFGLGLGYLLFHP